MTDLTVSRGTAAAILSDVERFCASVFIPLHEMATVVAAALPGAAGPHWPTCRP